LENVDTFFGHLKNFTDILDNLLPFGTFCVHFCAFGITHQEKSGNPAHRTSAEVANFYPYISVANFCAF
jgi:hypothetical protein